MILELDIGNSQAKWRLLDSNLRVRSAGLNPLERWLKGVLPAEWRGAGVRRIRAASVLSAETELALANLLNAELRLPLEYAKPVAACEGLRNGYREPHKLGVDRWLGALAAYKLVGAAVLVVDIGSALTIDVVDSAGSHIGGYIVPGPQLMQGSLLRDTERVRFPKLESLGDLSLGADTASCVTGGIGAAQVGAVLVGLQHARAQVGDDVCMFLTGGWASELAECLRNIGCNDFALTPELVLDGLRWALP